MLKNLLYDTKPRNAALVQFRAEVAAGLRTPNSPLDALWSAAWRQLVASIWRTDGHLLRADALERAAARMIATAARSRRVAA